MRPLRAYLLIHSVSGDWAVTAHLDAGNLQSTWKKVLAADPGSVGFGHVGFGRPDTGAFKELSRAYPGLLLVTASARYAFNKPVTVAPVPVGEIEQLPVFVVTDGWGYCRTAQELGLADDADPEWISKPAPRQLPSGWVARIGSEDPELSKIADSAGIFDEASYIEHEHRLGDAMRARLALFRLRSLTGKREPTDPCEIAQNGPQWLRDLSTASLEITVRISNVFKNEGIQFVRQLGDYTEAGLMRLPNFGKTSIAQLAASLLQAIGDGPLTSDERTARAETLSLVAHIRQDLAKLPERAAYIIRRRMGFGYPSATLQEIGSDMGVTRERIRQIEAKYLGQMEQASIWSALLIEKLAAILSRRSAPLPIEGLDVLDPWFTDIEHWPDTLAYIFDVFCERRFSLLHIQGQTVVTALTSEDWTELLRNAGRTLDNGAGQDWDLEQARISVEALVPDRASEMRETLWEMSSQAAHFAEIEGGRHVLTSYGRGVEHIVEAILAEAETPLHYGEIAEKASVRASKPIDVRRAHNAAANVGLLYGPGVYGHKSHFPLTDDEARTVAVTAEEIVEDGATGRQWHAAELCNLLIKRDHYFDGRLTPYVVSIALSQFSTLKFLGRLVWSHGAEGAKSKADRIDIRQAVASLLRRSGRPMTATELHRAVTQERGVGDHFQVQPIETMFRTDDGKWGLLDRDLPITSNEQAKLIADLIFWLEGHGKAVHFADIEHISTASETAKKVSAAVLRTIIARDGRLRLDASQYVYPTTWDGPRRMSAAQAIQEALKFSPPEGLSMKQLLRVVAATTGHEPPESQIVSLLQTCGARPNGTDGRWRLSDNEIEPSEAEDQIAVMI